jgi:uncharacterized protein YjbI with pentapeptide repeats
MGDLRRPEYHLACMLLECARSPFGDLVEVARMSRVRVKSIYERLRDKESMAHQNLRFLFLQCADLEGVDMSGADLQGARLAKANLRKAKLSRSILAGATMSECDLSGADLQHADFTGAILAGANFARSRLSNVTLRDAHVAGANFKRSIGLAPEVRKYLAARGAIV